jgi:hypothetical protein
MVENDEIAAWGEIQPPVALYLELKRQAGLRSTKARDGWPVLDQKRFEAIGLGDKHIRYRVGRWLLARNMIEVRSRPGCRLEYRLNPNWAKPKAEVVNLAAVRKVRKRAR